MELKTHINWRGVAIAIYCMAFVAYLIYGLQPVEASNYSIDNKLSIPEINLDTDVTILSLNNNKLDTPDTIVGSFSRSEGKTLLIGHSSTVFNRLHELKLNDEIYYNNKNYRVISAEKILKSNVNMEKILSSDKKDTIVLMTCAGEDLGGGDATHRLIITAI